MSEQVLMTREELEASIGATGRIVRIVGPVVDVEFPPDQLPGIYNALTVNAKTLAGEINVILEVDNIDTIKTLIRKNLGISILPKSTCMDEVRKQKMTILPIENLSMIRETNIIYLKDFSHPEVLQDITKLYNKISKSHK